MLLLQWYEGEVERAYHLHRARRVCEAHRDHQLFPTAAVPEYVRGRAAAGLQLPEVEVLAMPERPMTRAAKRKRQQREEGGQQGPAVVSEEERRSTLCWVVEDLNPELYLELMGWLRLP